MVEIYGPGGTLLREVFPPEAREESLVAEFNELDIIKERRIFAVVGRKPLFAISAKDLAEDVVGQWDRSMHAGLVGG